MGIKNREGQRFGRLTVVSLHSTKNGSAYWNCICDCGTSRVIRANCLRIGNTESCGCLNAQRRREPKVHGMAGTRTYSIWQDMISRCHRPNCRAFKWYGAKGIAVHPWWRQSFLNFYVDMGHPPTEKHEIDRIDGTRGYVPGNCRWSTSQQNSMNCGKKSNSKRFKGTSRHGSRWVANIKHNRVGMYLGTYATEEEAARVYDAKARELFGEFACLNFKE